MTLPIRLEVQTPSGWLDVLGSTNSIGISRSPMNLGTLTARLADVTLDPAQADTLASGRPIRFTALTGSTWSPIYTGKIFTGKVTYPRPEPGADPNKAARIEITAVDLMQPLGAASEPRSVHTTDNLRTLLAASGLPWAVNGTTTAGPASPLVVARNTGAFLADQVAITRDTVRGFAWVDAAGVLQVWDPASMPTAAAVTYSDDVAAPVSYSSVEASYDSTDVVDEIQVTFLVYKTSANATEEVVHTLRRPGATGTNTRSYTIVGESMSAAQIKTRCEQFAQAVLDRHATAVVRPLGLTTPVRTDAERTAAAAAEPCARVRVVTTGRLDAHVRVESVEHQVEAVTGKPDPVQWLATYTYGTPEAVPESQTLALVRSAPIQERLAAAEETAAAAVDPVASAARLTGQVIEPAAVTAASSDLGRIGLTSGVRNPTDPATVEVVQRIAAANRITIGGTLTPLKQAWIELVSKRDGALISLAPDLLTNLAGLIGARLGLNGSAPGGGIQHGIISTGTFTAVNTPRSIPIALPAAFGEYVPRVVLVPVGVNPQQLAVSLNGDPTTRAFTIRAARLTGTNSFDVQWVAFP